MAATTVPQAAPLQEGALLPFAYWPVAERLDGTRDVTTLAGELGLSVAGVEEVVRGIERELDVKLLGEQSAPPPVSTPPAPTISGAELARALVAAAVNVMGPMGEVLVEDALDELGEDAPATQLIGRVAQDLREPQRSAFLGRLRAKGLS